MPLAGEPGLSAVVPCGNWKYPVDVFVVSETVVAVAIAFEDGNVTNTSLVPADKLTAEPLLDEARIVVLASVVPEDVYVPIPTSHSVPPLDEIA
jgi:hypothetical protein